jgi:hypothetical protein
MDSGEPTIKPFEEIAGACRLLVRPPFATILLLEIFLAVVSASVGDLVGSPPADEFDVLLTVGSLFFGAVSIYLHIAATLAAGGTGEGSGEGWIRAAFRHRCFWRYVGALLLSIFLILLGTLAFVIGGMIVGSWVALSQTAVVLEKKRPVEAVNRSNELTRPVRKAVAIIFTVFWLPVLASAAVFVVMEVRLDLVPRVLVDVASTVLALAATVAFARVYVKLGGTPTPPLQTLLYKAEAGSPR